MRPRTSALCLMLCLCATVNAQFDTGQVTGYIYDASQAVVTGATVILINQGNGEQRRTTTNSSGYYIFPNVPVGKYNVAAEMAGQRSEVRTIVTTQSPPLRDGSAA